MLELRKVSSPLLRNPTWSGDFFQLKKKKKKKNSRETFFMKNSRSLCVCVCVCVCVCNNSRKIFCSVKENNFLSLDCVSSHVHFGGGAANDGWKVRSSEVLTKNIFQPERIYSVTTRVRENRFVPYDAAQCSCACAYQTSLFRSGSAVCARVLR